MPTEPQPNAPSAPPLNWSAAILAAGRAGRPRPGPLASPIVMVLLLFCIAASLHADDTNAISPIVSYQYFDSLDEPGASNTVMSAVVSYQYEDALNAPGAETTIISPIVSYQYYDWPGDENVILQSSPKVSYFYGVALPGANVAVQGRVVNALGQPVAGATVCASILDVPQVTTQSAPDGSYQLPPLAPGIFVLCASQTGLVSDKRVVTLSASLPAQDFRLASFSVLPAMQTANSTAPFILTDKDELHGAKLMVFDGTQFVDNLSLIDSSKMTVVLTHGWILCLRSGGIHNWPSNMARALRAKGLTSAQANIVGWSWETDATDCFVPDHLTPRHGLALGKKLYEVLGTGYSQPLDFQGHSLGALVNRYAVNYLHGQANAKQEKAAPAWSSSRTHVTIFDEAEAGRILSPANLPVISDLILLREGAEAFAWKTPIPMSAAWIDNYIADVGFPHAEAVNIALQKGKGVIAAHGYPQHWYSNSVNHAAENSLLGFRQSFAYHRMIGASDGAFRSATANFAKGSTYHQKPSSSDPLELEPLPVSDYFQPYFPVLGEPLDRVFDVADYVVPRVEGAMIRTGNAIVETVEYTAVSTYRGVNYVWSAAANGLDNAGATIRDLLSQPSIGATLRTGPPPFLGNLKANNAGPVSSNTPAYLWLPIAVPPDAVVMAFDFTITGDGKDDSFAFGINGTNLFSLETKFVADGELSTTRLMDVSAYAGLTNEFFFGIMGGTSTNCAVSIEGIRFFTLALPTLTITHTNGAAVLSWPSSANGFVLEASASLSVPAWSAVTNPPSLFDGRFRVANPWPGETRFFRLRH